VHTNFGKTDDEITVAVVQFASVADTQVNIDRIAAYASEAKSKGARLVAFPEASSYAFMASTDELARVAREDGDRFRRSMGDIARQNDIYLVVGLYAWGGGPLSDNLLEVFGPDGWIIDSYHKMHLYDAFSYRESEKNSVAELKADFAELTLFDIGSFRFGLVNCYDLRFPEQARALIQLGANVLIVSAGWTAGPLKELHWETLLRARAIENTVYVLASSQPAPLSAGLSMLVDPTGLVLGTVPGREGVACATLSVAHLKDVRQILPCLDHRRYRVVQANT
jgi:predicted amidohydrolase